MYAIVEVGGNQYRVEKDESIVVDRLSSDAGQKLELKPVFYRGDETLADPGALERVKVRARVLGHERGSKIRVLNFKPKGGHRRHVGHRSDQTRLVVTEISVGGAKRTSAKSGEQTASKADDKAPSRARGKASTKSTQKSPSQGQTKAGSSQRRGSKSGPKDTSKGSASESGAKPARRSRGKSDGS